MFIEVCVFVCFPLQEGKWLINGKHIILSGEEGGLALDT